MPFPSPGDLPDPGIKSMFLALAGRFFTTKIPKLPGKPTVDLSEQQIPQLIPEYLLGAGPPCVYMHRSQELTVSVSGLLG